MAKLSKDELIAKINDKLSDNSRVLSTKSEVC